ncbi:Sister chromatid cohesion protein 2, partial [Coemansia sp. Benny D160-2]
MLQGTAQSPEDLTAGFEGHSLSTKEYRMLLEKHQKAIDSASSSTDFTIRYLISRCARREGKAVTNEAEYRSFLENFTSDCVLLLGQPQWPAAELVVRVYSLHALELLDDEKADITLKTLSLESTAQIASHIACVRQALEVESNTKKASVLCPITTLSSVEDIQLFHKTTATLISYLQTQSDSNGSAGVISLYVSTWASMLIAILLKLKRLDSKRHSNGSNGPESQNCDGSTADEHRQNKIHSYELMDDDATDVSGEEDGSCSEYEEATLDGSLRNKKASIKARDIAEKRRAIEACLASYMDIVHR